MLIKYSFGIGLVPAPCRKCLFWVTAASLSTYALSAVVESQMIKVPKDEQVTMPSAEQTEVPASPHDAIIGLTRRGVINGWNRAATWLYGYPAEEIIGGTTKVLIAPGRRAEAADTLRRVLQGEPAEQYHTERVCKDGSVVAVSVSTSAIVDTAGVIVGALMVSRRLDEPTDEQDCLNNEYTAEGRLQTDADKKLVQADSQLAQRVEVPGRAGFSAGDVVQWVMDIDLSDPWHLTFPGMADDLVILRADRDRLQSELDQLRAATPKGI